jgi:hypothetical protein
MPLAEFALKDFVYFSVFVFLRLNPEFFATKALRHEMAQKRLVVFEDDFFAGSANNLSSIPSKPVNMVVFPLLVMHQQIDITNSAGFDYPDDII